MRMIAAAGLVLVAACGQAETPVAETPVTPAAAETPAPEPAPATVIGGVDLSQPARALGTEPFWAVEITASELVFSGLDRAEVRAANPGARMEGDAAVIAARDAGGAELVLTLKAIECSDGMSDRVYPLEAEVKLGAETLKGCAASQAMLDAGPRP